MAQRLEAFIAHTDVLRRFAQYVPGFRMLALSQGLSLGPMPEALRPKSSDEQGTVGTWCLTDELAAAAVEVSRHGLVGWFETTPGWQGVATWRQGRETGTSDWEDILEALGVIATVPRAEHGWLVQVLFRPPPPRPRSRWQTLGLDQWLSSEIAYDYATPVEMNP